MRPHSRMQSTYLGIDGMTDAKRSHDDIPQNLTVLVLLHASRRLTGSSRFGRKTKSVADRQLRKMDILLCRVDCLSSEVAVHLLRGDTYGKIKVSLYATVFCQNRLP